MTAEDFVLIGLGANLDHPHHGSPRSTVEAALAKVDALGPQVLKRSCWYRSAPVPPSGQPWFVNGVARLETDLEALALLDLLHRVEAEFGRQRGRRNAARTLDLDLLDFRGRVSAQGEGLCLPHPRLHERAFVLLPLRDVAPDWRHPVSGSPVRDLIEALPADQRAEVLPEAT